MNIGRIDFQFLELPADFQGIEDTDGIYSRVIGYSQAADYTLVVWARGTDEEYFTAEFLYRGSELISSGGGALDLYEKPPEEEERLAPTYFKSVWERVDRRLGNYGIPSSIAIALRDPINYISLENR